MTAPSLPPRVSVELTVPFHDVDALHVVWHGHYMKYLEIARTELMRACNLGVNEVTALGFRMLVVDVGCRYTSSLRFDDRFKVTAWFVDINYRILIAYEIVNLTHPRKVARARTSLVTTTPAGELLLETPDAIRSRILT